MITVIAPKYILQRLSNIQGRYRDLPTFGGLYLQLTKASSDILPQIPIPEYKNQSVKRLRKCFGRDNSF